STNLDGFTPGRLPEIKENTESGRNAVLIAWPNRLGRIDRMPILLTISRRIDEDTTHCRAQNSRVRNPRPRFLSSILPGQCLRLGAAKQPTADEGSRRTGSAD